MRKLALIAAGAIGYLLGSRAGREPYEKFSKQAEKVMNDPRVKKRASQVKHQAEERADGESDREQTTGAGPQGPLP